MRITIGLALVAALGAAACTKKSTSAEAVGSGSAAGSAGQPVTPPPVDAATGWHVAPDSAGVITGSAGSAAAPFDAKAALDAALKTKGIADKDVTRRASGAHSAWALFASKTHDNMITEYTVMEASAQGLGELHITARGGGDNPGLSKDVDTFDVRDLDGDGHDECLAVITWQLDHTFPYAKGCKKCEYGEGESGKELYIIASDDAGYLKVPFDHIVEYTTLSQPESATDPDPPPPEKIAYDWKVEGKPPVVTLTRTDYTLNPKRPKQLLDPASDPQLSAGSGSAVPLVLKQDK